ncbi:MAG TPA: MGMT family protein [Planktothrix sp.]|jgi:methylated-DNA-protein-cysteine methyltransferase-like protein
MTEVYAEIYTIVQGIPKGRVLTYGLISSMIGGRMSAQGVGWALKALGARKRNQPKESKAEAKEIFNMDTVPWQRVVNSSGGTSTHKIADIPPDLQRHLLEAEGVVFNDEGQLNLDEYLWKDGLSN